MTARKSAAWALAALLVVGVAFAVGMATAPDATAPSAKGAPGPQAVDLPSLGKVAPLPALHQEPTEATEISAPSESGEVTEETFVPESAPEGGGEGGGGGGGGGGGEEIVPEGH
ncbi:MAG: hypothetical protein WD827_08045 [Solirubrobacterales bacterium]